MPVDASIPLQAGQNIPQFGTSPTQQLTLARLALALQQQRQQQAGINALKMLYANPQNLDASGMPTPGSVNKLMQVSPQLGMQMQNALAMNEERQARMGYLRSAEGDRAARRLRGATEEALGTYDEGIRAGMTPQQAQARGQQVLSSAVADLRASGTMPGMVGANPRFDPIAARGMLFNYQRDQAQQIEQKKLDQSQQQGQQKLSLQRDKLGLDTQKAQNANYGPPQMVEVPGAKDQPPRQVIGRFDRVTGKYFDLDGNLLKPSRIIPASQNLPGGETAAGPASNLHGADYLGTLSSAEANQVKALAEGRMQFPSRALRSSYWTNKLLQVSQYDPGFDAVNYGARFTTRKDFTSGKSAQAITSFNTAIGHLGTLYKAADQLGNSWSPTYNSVKNFLSRNSGSPTVVRFNTAKQAVADELTRAFRGTGGNVSDIKGWEENINAAESPDQLHEAIRQAVELLTSRIDAVGQQYNRGMGTTSQPVSLLSPAARRALAGLPGGKDLIADNPMAATGQAAASPPPAAGAAPAAASPSAPATDMPPVSVLKEGQATTFANGQVWTLRNGQPARVQ